jgi:Ni,Fe-hydrogenase I cytochrome b subunit
MSEPKGIFSAIAEPIGQEMAQHLNAPPLRRNQNRAVWGTLLIAGGTYVGYSYVQGISLDEAVHGYIGVLHRPFDESWPFYAWGAAMLFGLLWVVVGVRGSRGPRDTMATFWSLAWLAGASAALWNGWYTADYPGLNWFLRGGYIMAIAGALMMFFLVVRGSGRGAAHSVQTHISTTARFFRIGRRRSF